MPRNHGKSFLAKTGEMHPEWHLVDAKGQVLGRLAVRIATILMGKHKPTYTPHTLTGDFVVVVNARSVKLTGRKLEAKTYDRYTYYPSGRKVMSIRNVLESNPERVIRSAVRRMLPKNKLGRHMLARMKVFSGTEHEHQAQNPRPLAM